MTASHAFTVSQQVEVSADWLAACGFQRFIGRPFIITNVRHYGEGRTMLDVTTPDGSAWVVWTSRGVTPYVEPAPAQDMHARAAASFLAAAADRSACLAATPSHAGAADQAIAAIEAGLVASGAIDAPARAASPILQRLAEANAALAAAPQHSLAWGKAFDAREALHDMAVKADPIAYVRAYPRNAFAYRHLLPADMVARIEAAETDADMITAVAPVMVPQQVQQQQAKAGGMRYAPAIVTDAPETLDNLPPGQWIAYGTARGRYMGRKGGCVWIAWGRTASRRFPAFAEAFRA